VTLLGTIPVLRILDAAKAREFYVDFLGFTVGWEHRFDGDAPLYMEVALDGCTIHLTEHHGDCIPGAAVRVRTRDVDGYSQRLRDKNYRHARPGVEAKPWGTREMAITDPFGNTLIFVDEPAG